MLFRSVQANAESIANSIITASDVKSMYFNHEVIIITGHEGAYQADPFLPILHNKMSKVRVVEVMTAYPDSEHGVPRFGNINFAFKSILQQVYNDTRVLEKQTAIVWISEKGDQRLKEGSLDKLEESLFDTNKFFMSGEYKHVDAYGTHPARDIMLGTLVMSNPLPFSR